jgi:hypothetical protein
MKLPKRCPQCKQLAIDWDCRRCRNCGVAILREGDDGHANRGELWFKYCKGRFGLGFYQKAFFESTELVGPGGQIVRSDPTDPYAQLAR